MNHFGISSILALVVLSACGGGDVKLVQVGAVPPFESVSSSSLSNARRDARVPFFGYLPDKAFMEIKKRSLEDVGVYVEAGVCMAQFHVQAGDGVPIGADEDIPWVVFTIAERDLSRARSLGLQVVVPNQGWQEIPCDWRWVSSVEQTVNGIRLPNF